MRFIIRSVDGGKTFSQPKVVGRISEMHLGMTRGPQLPSSKDLSIVTAIDKKGNIHAFKLNHESDSWEKAGNVNDTDGSAPEGLITISADDKNNFYAVWLDLRENRKNIFALLHSTKKEAGQKINLLINRRKVMSVSAANHP